MSCRAVRGIYSVSEGPFSAYSRHWLHFRTKPGCGRRSASEIKCYVSFDRAMRACLNRQRARLYLKTGAGTRVLRTLLLKPRRGIFTCPARSESPSSYFGIMRGARNWRRSRRQSKAVQYFSDCIRGMDCRHNPHAAAATSAFENVDRKNAFHQFSPSVVPGVRQPRLLRTFALRMGFAFPGRAAGVGDGLECFGVCGDHERAPARARPTF
jgi:hypothetical protein